MITPQSNKSMSVSAGSLLLMDVDLLTQSCVVAARATSSQSFGFSRWQTGKRRFSLTNNFSAFLMQLMFQRRALRVSTLAF